MHDGDKNKKQEQKKQQKSVYDQILIHLVGTQHHSWKHDCAFFLLIIHDWLFFIRKMFIFDIFHCRDNSTEPNPGFGSYFSYCAPRLLELHVSRDERPKPRLHQPIGSCSYCQVSPSSPRSTHWLLGYLLTRHPLFEHMCVHSSLYNLKLL